MSKWDLRRQMAAGGLVIGCLIGGPLGYVGHMLKPQELAQVKVDESVKVRGVVSDEGLPLLLLSDGKTVRAQEVKADKTGVRYRVGATWFVS